MAKIRITVVRRELYPELVAAYGSPKMQENGLPRCQTYKDGQVIEIEGSLVMPEGFCSWAWADLQRDFAMMLCGPPDYWKTEPFFACCTDGFRPVVFKIEHVSEPTTRTEGEA
jgi:uncharacterized repeat protein (TIGR04076 family)